MTNDNRPILVFGATGQQGGSVATALLRAGRPVRAFVRDPSSAKATALREAGAELVRGDLSDEGSIREALKGTYGVFSVQPSSGQGALYGVSDDDEVRYGTNVAALAAESGVEHFVYSSSNAVGGGPTGMGHFDSKARIEEYVRALPIATTIVRPASFMEMLTMPGFGLDEGRFVYFMNPGQQVQVLAVDDIGRIVAAIFADPERFEGVTMEIASDGITGDDLSEAFGDAAGRPIQYLRFPDSVLADNPFLGGLSRLVDDGRLAGKADLGELGRIAPPLTTFRAWLAGPGAKPFKEAIGSGEAWSYNS